MSEKLAMSSPLETCLDCECALVGSESRFCSNFVFAIRAEAAEYGRETPGGPSGDVIDEQEVKAFLEQVNMDLNTLLNSARDIQRSLKNFAGEHELPYAPFREDKRYSSAVPSKDAGPGTGGAA